MQEFLKEYNLMHKHLKKIIENRKSEKSKNVLYCINFIMLQKR
jgi:hypothetical protein